MNLYRYFEAKAQNKRTANMIRALVDDGRVLSLPGAIGSHYRRMDPVTGDPFYRNDNLMDKPIIRLLTCSNDLEVQMAYNGDTRVIGSNHTCKNKNYCAVCGTREARRVSSQFRFLFHKLENLDYRYYMLTLTLPNRFDGFHDEFVIYNKCLNDLLAYCGWKREGKNQRSISYCKGAFAAKELTYSYNKGFHPHMHIVLAYDSNYIVSEKLTRKGYVKSLVLSSGKFLDGLSIRDEFVRLICRKFPIYAASISESLSDLNIGFEPISNIDSACEEICKYLCDYNSFTDKDPKKNDYKKNLDAFYIFLRDSFGIKKYNKLGCFGWNPDIEAEWKVWVSQGKPTSQNAHFIQFVTSKYLDMVYFGIRHCVNSNGELIGVPWFYRKDELYYDGDSVYLQYDSKSMCYKTELYDKHKRKLSTKILSIDDSDRLINLPRDDVAQLCNILFSQYKVSSG